MIFSWFLSSKRVILRVLFKGISISNEENPENPILYFEGSALDKTNIKEIFDVYFNYLKEKYLLETKKIEDPNGASFKLGNANGDNQGGKKKGCC